MNAPANIRPQRSYEHYMPLVDSACAKADREERIMRCRMMWWRDQATMAMRNDGLNWMAAQLLRTIEQIGLYNALRSMAKEDLRDIGESMSQMYFLAARLDQAGGDCA